MRRVSLQTPEQFRSLAATLIAARAPAADEPAFEIVHEVVVADHRDEVPDESPNDDELELAREVRLFHARIIEAAEAAVDALVSGIAADVLGRELVLAPAEIEAIVDRALQRLSADEPLRVRVHADDVPRLQCGVPVVADSRLRRGDAMIELRTGTADVSLGVRLSALVRAATP